jgi:hypothetical protein
MDDKGKVQIEHQISKKGIHTIDCYLKATFIARAAKC